MGDAQLSRVSLITGPVRPAYAELPAGRVGVSAVYVHVPFCTMKCHYCDFYSVAGRLGEADGYLRALEREVAMQVGIFGRQRPETVFIGGGTPTLLDAGRLGRLLEILRGVVDMDGVREFTVEGNPNTFSEDRAEVLVRNGVNRISFGAQSFVKGELEQLQRDHDPESVGVAVGMARRAGLENINLDLIFGVPGQTVESWDYSLQRALELGPEHVSCYSLIYEPNTAMTARLHRGEVTAIEEEVELALFERTYEVLRGAGFGRYEVSNYAKAGRECQHNLHYWKGSEYLAFGPAAAGHVRGWRWKNVSSVGHYVEALGGEGAVLPVTQMEKLEPMRRAGELAMLQLRLVGGIDYAEFERRTGVDPRGRLKKALAKYEGLGVIEGSEERMRVTEKGVAVSDRIVRDVMEAFDEGD